MSIFKDKVLLITGGTGSFGKAVLNRFLGTDIREIRIFSRDEEKQDRMRHDLQSKKVTYYIGNVRDKESLKEAFYGVDYIFHAAALKEVPSCEFFPLEAVKTNILGTDNVLSIARDFGVKKVICLSTDKAAYPINAMGMTKALMEKVYIAKTRTIPPSEMIICGTRYGNVMYSRGSVIPLFIHQIRQGKPLTITDPNMTRFMMTLEEAVDLVLWAFEQGNQGDTFIKKSPSATLGTLAEAVKELFATPEYPMVNIGIRHGEKLYETLLTREEHIHSVDMGNFFKIVADNRDLNYDNYFINGTNVKSDYSEFSSENCSQLTVAELKQKLLTIPDIVEELKLMGKHDALNKDEL